MLLGPKLLSQKNSLHLDHACPAWIRIVLDLQHMLEVESDELCRAYSIRRKYWAPVNLWVACSIGEKGAEVWHLRNPVACSYVL